MRGLKHNQGHTHDDITAERRAIRPAYEGIETWRMLLLAAFAANALANCASVYPRRAIRPAYEGIETFGFAEQFLLEFGAASRDPPRL